MFETYEVRDMYIKKIKEDYQDLVKLLEENDLLLEEGIQHTIGIYKDSVLLASGSIKGNILMCIAVKEDRQNSNIINILMENLLLKARNLGIENLFVFTKDRYINSFKHLGFNLVSMVNGVAVLEIPPFGLSNYLKKISKLKFKNDSSKTIGSIIMNCNPFTLGHRFLVEESLKYCDYLYIFIVEEDKSTFPFLDRYEMVLQGVNDLGRVKVIPGGDYIISSITFPSYFLKNKNVKKHQADIDIDIFTKHIASTMNINKRFVGTEPYCETTKMYNEVLSENLKESGIDLVIIERFIVAGEYVSASKVRRILIENDFDKLNKYLPKSTIKYLKNMDLSNIISSLKKKDRRH